MTIHITERAGERSTFVAVCTLTDETGAAMTPTTVAWTLRDGRRKVINSRLAVTLTPASVVTVVMTGDDLALSRDPRRYLLIEATYSSSNGSGLAFREEVQFSIAPAVGVQ